MQVEFKEYTIQKDMIHLIEHYLNRTRFNPFCPLGKVVNVIYMPGSYCSAYSSLDAFVPFGWGSVLATFESSTDPLLLSWHNSLPYTDFNLLENTIGELHRLSTFLSFGNLTSGGLSLSSFGGRFASTPSFASFAADIFSDSVWSCPIRLIC